MKVDIKEETWVYVGARVRLEKWDIVRDQLEKLLEMLLEREDTDFDELYWFLDNIWSNAIKMGN